MPLADILLTTPLVTQEAMFRTRVATLVVLEAILDAVAAERPEHLRAETVEETFTLMRGYLSRLHQPASSASADAPSHQYRWTSQKNER